MALEAVEGMVSVVDSTGSKNPVVGLVEEVTGSHRSKEPFTTFFPIS